MWGIGIVCLFLTLLVQLAIDVVPAEAAKDEVRLRVSIHKEPFQAVSSCVHAFSQVELLNLVRRQNDYDTFLLKDDRLAPLSIEKYSDRFLV